MRGDEVSGRAAASLPWGRSPNGPSSLVTRRPLALVGSALLFYGCAWSPPALAQEATSPAAHLGRPLGADFELADWEEVSSYFRRLADESPCVHVETVGETTEGRDFLLAVVSSPENLEALPDIRAAARRLADPRGMDAAEREGVLARARPMLFVSIAMHSTEAAGPQFGMELAHTLATSPSEPYASARREAVVLIAPCLNPDGLDKVVEWYRRTVGTPYEAAGMLELYQHYAGHDNNRDWFMLSQDETRVVTRLLYDTWFPQVYWDVHQQGTSRERFFVPPFRDPLNPNLDPGVIGGIAELGTRALFDMTREGLAGVSTGVTFDMWWNGGNRNVPVRHNVIGLLTEAASVRIATPVFLPPSSLDAPAGLSEYAPSHRFPLPWPGGWWRIRDIIDYEHAFARSILASLAREPRLWLENALGAAERAIRKGREDAPRAWILPSDEPDRAAVGRLIDSLLLGGVEIHVVDEEITADGRTWPAGSLVIRRDQPYGQHVKDLFEVQRYPEGEPPYDVTGWTLPLLLGVHRVEVEDELPPGPPLRRVETVDAALAGFASAAAEDGALDVRDGDTWRALVRHLAAGGAASFGVGEETAGRVRLHAAGEATADGEDWRPIERLPRVGLYAPWSDNMDEGWARWVFDAWGVPYVRVRNAMIRAGRLEELLDVLVLPSVSARELDRGREAGTVPPEYADGLGAEGAAAIEAFVRGGGRLVAVERSAAWAIDLFRLPLVDEARASESFSCPGSVLRGVPEPSPFTVGMPASLALFFSRSAAWKVVEPPEAKGEVRPADDRAVDVLLRYAPTHVLLSGWIRGPEAIADRAAWCRVAHGDGAIHLIGFRPQYRGWSQAAFPILFRALLLER